MRPHQAVLERRRQLLHARIAVQREQLAHCVDSFRGPLRAFEVAREMGEGIRRHAPAIGTLVLVGGVLFMRGGMFARTARAVRLFRRMTSWFGMARWALRAVQRRPKALA
jgi:hypothetical protein